MTHRGVSTHFTVVTGHEDPAKDRTDVDWDALARAGGTLVILMGAGRIGEIARRLIDGGRAPDTPVAAVRNGTRPDQHTVRATLATDRRRGRAGAERDRRRRRRRARPRRGSRRDRCSAARWWSTRAREQASELRARLEDARRRGARAPRDRDRADRLRAARRSTAYEWLVFTSVNGVRRVLRPRPRARRARRPRARRRAGRRHRSRHRARAGRRGASAPTSSPSASWPSRCSTRSPRPTATGARVLLARAEQARDVLPDGLAERGLRGRRAARVPHGARPTPDARVVARVRGGRRRRDHVHVVVDGRQLLRPSSIRSPTRSHSSCRSGPSPRRPRAARGLRGRRRGRPTTPSTAWSTTLLAAFAVTGAGPHRQRRQTGGRYHPRVTFPERRMRRLRRTPALRRLVAEARLSVDDLVAPLFVKEGIDAPEPIVSMPGVVQHTQESLRKEVRALADLGVPAVILFGVPATKDARGSGADDPDGVVQVALRNLRDEVGRLARADGRRLPRRVHRPRPLRPAHRRRRGRQRLDPRALRVDRDRAGRRGGRRDRAVGDDGRAGRRDPRRARRVRPPRRPPSSPTRRSTRRRCTARSATPPSARRSSATGAATRWTRPTRARRSTRPRSTSPRAPTW